MLPPFFVMQRGKPFWGMEFGGELVGICRSWHSNPADPCYNKGE